MKLLTLYSSTIFMVCFGLSLVSAAMEANNILVTILAMATGFAIFASSVFVGKKLAGLE